MPPWLPDAVDRLGANPWMQGLLAALATFILEDPTTVGCGLLVADGRMAFQTALIGVATGIALGDIGLYGLGRWLGPSAVRRGWIKQDRLDRASVWFQRNLVGAVVLSRFVPGMRVPTFVGAGVLHAPFWRFVLVAVGASLAWTLFLLSLTIRLGEAILPLLGRARWPLALGALGLFVLLQWLAARRARAEGDGPPVVSRFEFWPPWLFYIPVGVYYTGLSIRFLGPLLPTAANPSIHGGGLIGESKASILELVPDPQRRWVAPWIVARRGDGSAEAETDAILASLEQAGLSLPVVAKPDVGQRGAGVRPIRHRDQLRDYVELFPVGERIVVQRLAGEGEPGEPEAALDPRLVGVREAGVLYWRRPGEDEGEIFSITLKLRPRVVGDGTRTLRQLIRDDPRASRLEGLYLGRHADDADRVLDDGEVLPLVFAGNHCQGAIFRDGTNLATPELYRRIHEIAGSMREFYFGRFDIVFDDPAAFLRGEGLQIIEINGAGAEATHIWDASVSLVEAYATLFEQFRMLFEIGAANRRRGHRPQSAREFIRDIVTYRRTARRYPLTE